MDSLIKLAARALIEYGKAGTPRAMTMRATAALCLSFAAVILLAALGCAAAALWIFALPSLGPVGAPLIVAAMLLMVTLALAATAWFVMRPRQGRASAAAPPLLLAEALRLFSEHKGAVLLAAVVAGMAAETGGRKS